MAQSVMTAQMGRAQIPDLVHPSVEPPKVKDRVAQVPGLGSSGSALAIRPLL